MGRPGQRSTVASLHTESYKLFVKMLAAKREAAGLTQRDVAKALGWRQSVIARIELHDRRLDVIELVQLASVIGLDPAKLIRELRALMIKRGDVTD